MLSNWFSAIRIKTLAASVVPVCLGGASMGFLSPNFPWLSFSCCLIFAILIQVGTNLANDYYDGVRGTDDFRGLAPRRMVADGFISPETMYRGAWVILICAFFSGTLAVFSAGASWWFMPFGLACIGLAFAYTGGPFPLAYNGLGDLFVILFFGFFALEGTKILLATAMEQIWTPDWYASIGTGLLINNLLIVNNYRDYEGDRMVGKKTSVVLFGKTFGSLFYLLSSVTSLALFPLLGKTPIWIMIVLAVNLTAWWKLRKATTKQSFDNALKLTAISLLSYGLIFISIKIF